MSTINLEVMKQLLQEFVEKEALVAEELKVVQRQIEELEQRVNNSRNKLQLVADDKEKIGAMFQRYAGGAGLIEQNSQAARPSPEVQSLAVPSQPVVAAGPILSEATASTNAGQPAASINPSLSQGPIQAPKPGSTTLSNLIASSLKSKESVEISSNQAVPEATSQQTAEPPAEENKGGEATDESSDEAVKSINDALRGLFR